MNKFNHTTSLLVLMAIGLFCTTGCTTSGTKNEGIEFKNKDNTVYVRLPAEPDRLNPSITLNTYSRYIHSNIFQELLSFDPNTLEEVPILAKALPVVENTADGVSYTYELFEEATWSDGKPVTAKDVIFSFKIMFNLNIALAAPYRAGLNFIKDIVEDPDNDRKFTVFTNDVYFLAETSINSMTILPVHAFDPDNLMTKYAIAEMISNGEGLAKEKQLKDFATLFTSAPYSRDGDKLIGSGAYRLQEWVEGQTITITKVDNWWGETRDSKLTAYPDKLVFRVITDQAASINALKDELIDVNVQVDATDFTNLKTNEFVSEHYNFYSPDAYTFYYIALNNGDPKLSDKKVRRALAHLLDMDFLIDEQFQGLATRMNNTPVLPSKSYFDSSLKSIELDIDKAKALLEEAGWKDTNGNGTVDKEIDGEVLEMELDYLVSPGSKFGNTMAELFKDNAIQGGVQINIIPREMRAVLQGDVASRSYHIFGLGASAYPVPDDFTQQWHTSSNTPRGSNRVQFGNAESDALIDEIKITLDPDDRAKLYKEFQRIIYDEQPMIFLFAPKERIIISKRFDAEVTILRPGFRPSQFKLKQ